MNVSGLFAIIKQLAKEGEPVVNFYMAVCHAVCVAGANSRPMRRIVLREAD